MAESTEQLAAGAGQAAVRAASPLDLRNLTDLRDFGAQVRAAGRNPVGTAKAMIDWDTWRSDPARAAGHLLPDLAVAVAGGGTAAGARAAETLRRGRGAVQAAAARDTARREAAGAAATASRQALVRQAMSAAERPGARPWRGEAGIRLNARQNASAEAFHALSSAPEPAITAALRQVSRIADTDLAGLKHRLKEVDSLKRKLGTRVRGRRPLPVLLEKTNDVVRYAVVLDDADYVPGVRRVAAQIEREGFHHRSPPFNAWHSPGYRGLNTTWLDPDRGVAFEVQFHTPDSWRITGEVHDLYEELRLPHTSRERRAELDARIAEAYRAAAIPDGVTSLSGSSLPPPSPPDPIVPPPDRTLPAGLIAGLAAELGSAQPRREPGPDPPSR